MANLPSENEEVHPCEVCGRNFVKNSLVKHEAVCRKMARAKRKIFDSGKQRATGSDITIDNVINARKEREMLGGIFPRPKTSWREKHELFVNAVSTSKQANYPPPGDPFSTLSKAVTPKDYVKCKYCGRSFNETAAERHIPFCKTQQEKKGPMKIGKISSRSSNTTMTSSKRDSKMTSKKNDCHPAIPESHLNVPSRRSESVQRSHVDKSSGNDRRRGMSSSRTSSYRANSREKTPTSSRQSSFTKKKK